MFVKNAVARILNINLLVNGKSEYFAVYPGDHPAVELPDAEASRSDFVQNLIKTGALIEVVAPKQPEVEEKKSRKSAYKE